MKSKGRRLSVQEKVESKRSGVPRLRVLFALFAALLVIGVAVGCGERRQQQRQRVGWQLRWCDHHGEGRGQVGRPDGQRRRQRLRRSTSARSPAGLLTASKSPITIGWVNQQGGPTDVGPGATKGAELAVKYLNEKLGGIDGHPVKLFKCFTSTSEEQGQTCGQKMVNNKDVKVITMGAVAIGDQSLVATVDAYEADGLERRDRRRRCEEQERLRPLRRRHPGLRRRSPRTRTKSSAPSRSSVVWPELPGINESSQAIVDGAKKLGMEVKSVRLEPERDRPRRPADGSRCADART